MASASQHAGSSEPAELGREFEEIEIDDSDFVWDSETGAPATWREAMPTLPDLDPLRHDLVRESLPTLRDFDPLRHDSDMPPRPASDQSHVFRKLGR